MTRCVTIGAVVIGLALSSCGGDDENATTSPGPSDTVETPTEGAPAPSGLPPEFLQCMADEGFAIKEDADIHSAPQQVLQACFGSLHGGTSRSSELVEHTHA